jgi:hypothetical protein
MSFRDFSRLLYASPAPAISPAASPEAQLQALATYAHRHLDHAFLEGRPATIRAAARFLLDCHAVLSRGKERLDDSPAQTATRRECEIENQAMIAMMQARPDILEVFVTFRDQIASQWQ